MSDLTKNDNDQPGLFGRENYNVGYALVSGIAATVTPFHWKKNGVWAFSRDGPVGAVALTLYSGFVNSPEFLKYYGGPWLAMVMWRRLTASRYQIAGYQGMSPLMRWLPEGFAKRLDGALVLVGGWLLLPYQERLGMWLILGGSCVVMRETINHVVRKRREILIRDAMYMGS